MPTYLLSRGHLLHLNAGPEEEDDHDADEIAPQTVLREHHAAIQDLQREARALGLRVRAALGAIKLMTTDGRVLVEADHPGVISRRLARMQAGRL